MSKHKVEYFIPLTGSKLFDVVMYNTAKKFCEEYPGLDYEYGEKSIRVFGELDDYWYDKYQEAMFSKNGTVTDKD